MSGCALVVSSVTYITGKPASTHIFTESLVNSSSLAGFQSSVYCLIWLQPRNAATSIGIPTLFEISIIGFISAAIVLAAQFGAIVNPSSLITLAKYSTTTTSCSPAPGKPKSVACIPKASIRRRSSARSSLGALLLPIVGDCLPSLNVSSSRSTPVLGTPFTKYLYPSTSCLLQSYIRLLK